MDAWTDNHRHKRSHAQMSLSLSSSPGIFRGPSTSNFGRYDPSTPAANNDLFLERRRTSHPHNSQTHAFQLPADDMPPRSQSQQRPRLEHRASQTVIDLTDDVEGAALPVALPRMPWPRAPRPPHLGRSDAQGLQDVIDLTEDDAEIQITGARNRELPLPRPHVARPPRPPYLPRPASPGGLFLQDVQPVPPPGLAAAGGFAMFAGGDDERGGIFQHLLHAPQVMLQQLLGHAHAQQPMPQMDYRHAAFVERKPDHNPPEPAKPGFTRSLLETDTVICPCCEQELIHEKNEEPILKKGGKAPSRKEREEHPFWVVKDCGHVYCNQCYQNRKNTSKSKNIAGFPEVAGKSAKLIPVCAVEDCESEIQDKGKWVGVFL